jgi:signal transduction histidine kinase
MRDRLRWDVVTGTLGWLLVVLVIGVFDVLTGPEYGFGFFYLLAVLPAAWKLGRVPGLIVAIASGIAWFFADALQQRIGTIWPAAWNASSRLLVFVLAAILIDLVRRERERLRTLDAHRSRFMRVLEHELASPGRELAEGLRTLQAAGGASAAALAPMLERAEDLQFLSRDFVALGQLQSGELWLQHTPVDLRTVVEELRARTTEGGPRMPLTLSTGSLVVEGDEARLRQAIAGLLAEAQKSAGHGDVTIDVRRESGSVKVTISAGIGAFLAAGPDDRGGVGVELARMIVEAHGGRLDFRREAASKAVRFIAQLPMGSPPLS